MLRIIVIVLLSCGVAHADVLSPEIEDCRGKKPGDACAGGVCASVGKECQAGACRRHAEEAACVADGCRWVEVVVCQPAPPSAAPPPSTKQGCAAAPSPWWLSALMLLCARRRR